MLLNDEGEVVRQDKGHKLSLHAKFALKVAKEVAIVDVEQLPVLGHHDVVRVAVSNPQHIGSHTVASTRIAEVVASSGPSARSRARKRGHRKETHTHRHLPVDSLCDTHDGWFI